MLQRQFFVLQMPKIGHFLCYKPIFLCYKQHMWSTFCATKFFGGQKKPPERTQNEDPNRYVPTISNSQYDTPIKLPM